MDDLLGLVIGDWPYKSITCTSSGKRRKYDKPAFSAKSKATSLGHFESYYKKEI